MTTSTGAPRSMWLLVGVFSLSGLLHLVRPRPFEAIVPHRLPARSVLVAVSGGVELLCAAGLAAPLTRRPAALTSAVLLVAIFPANVQMAVDALAGRPPVLAGHPRLASVVALARLPLQLPLIRIALRAARQPPRRQSDPVDTSI